MSMIINKSSWASYKELLDKKNPNWQHDERVDDYYLFFNECGDVYTCTLPKTTPASADQVAWETVYKPRSNYAVASRQYSFSTPDFEFVGDGVMLTCAFGQTAAASYKILAAGQPGLYVNGGELYTANAVIGDWIEVQVVDQDNILGYGANFVVKDWVKKWYVNPVGAQSVVTPYAGKIPGGLYLRMTYHSTGISVNVKATLNLLLHLAI